MYSWINSPLVNKVGKYDLINKNNAPLCHIVGCRKHKDLKRKYRGDFCPKHIYLMKWIRTQLYKEKNTPSELYWRHIEIYIRKIPDKRYIHYVRVLQNEIAK